MPIFEFECPICGVFEFQQKITDEPLSTCPACLANGTSSTVKKLISLSTFHLMGSGWAKDKYSK